MFRPRSLGRTVARLGLEPALVRLRVLGRERLGDVLELAPGRLDAEHRLDDAADDHQRAPERM